MTKGKIMAKEIILIVDEEDCEVFAREGYAAGDPAVKVEWGFATGSDTGIHNAIDTFAIAEAGKIGEDGDFEPDKYTEADLGKRIWAKAAIGLPVRCEGWTPDGENDDIDWENFEAWKKDFCERTL